MNPLSINQKPFVDFSENEKKKLKKLHDYDLSFLEGEPSYRMGIVERRLHHDAIEELKKFFAIKILRDIHPLGMFSPLIAGVWHAFILDTQEYEKFCTKLYGGTIHHIPGGGKRNEIDNSIWMSVYKEWFGSFPPVWKMDKNGNEIPGYEYMMNVEGNVNASDQDSDDGAFALDIE